MRKLSFRVARTPLLGGFSQVLMGSFMSAYKLFRAAEADVVVGRGH
jgi:hypothetical protein